jgi:hypothetical protein
MGPQSRKLPETLERLNSKLRALRDEGLSDKIVDFACRFLHDDHVGPFARLTFVMEDGGKLTFDTLEFADILRAAYAH